MKCPRREFFSGPLGYDQINKALRAYEAAHGIKFETYPEHPLVEFGLPGKYAERLMSAGWCTINSVVEQGVFVQRAEGIGKQGYAAIEAAVGAWRVATF